MISMIPSIKSLLTADIAWNDPSFRTQCERARKLGRVFHQEHIHEQMTDHFNRLGSKIEEKWSKQKQYRSNFHDWRLVYRDSFQCFFSITDNSQWRFLMDLLMWKRRALWRENELPFWNRGFDNGLSLFNKGCQFSLLIRIIVLFRASIHIFITNSRTAKIGCKRALVTVPPPMLL